MRIVIFSNPGRIVNYPQEGVSAFGKTRRIGTDIVGEYKGNASEGDLPNYGGQWPINPAPTGSNVSKIEFLDRMTNEEQEALITSNNPKANVVLKRLELAGEINTADPRVIAAVTLLETPAGGSILTAGRAAEILI